VSPFSSTRPSLEVSPSPLPFRPLLPLDWTFTLISARPDRLLIRPFWRLRSRHRWSIKGHDRYHPCASTSLFYQGAHRSLIPSPLSAPGLPRLGSRKRHRPPDLPIRGRPSIHCQSLSVACSLDPHPYRPEAEVVDIFSSRPDSPFTSPPPPSSSSYSPVFERFTSQGISPRRRGERPLEMATPPFGLMVHLMT
jgi:hypothetical protein